MRIAGKWLFSCGNVTEERAYGFLFSVMFGRVLILQRARLGPALRLSCPATCGHSISVSMHPTEIEDRGTRMNARTRALRLLLVFFL